MTTEPNVEETALRLHALAIHLLRRLRREDAALGLSAARLSALSVVGFAGPRTLGELAAAEGVAPPTMTRIVTALERLGLVERRPDSADGRLVRIVATTAGRELLERGRARRAGVLASWLAALAPADLRAVERTVELLEERLTRAL